MALANDLRKGMAIRYNGNPAIVLEVQHRTPGNLRAFVQAIIRYINTGKSADVRFGSTDKVETVDVSRQSLEFSYKDHQGYHFMDPESYETISLNQELLAEAKDYLVENLKVEVLSIEGRPVQVELPSSVAIKIVESAEGVKGDSANNVQKPAVLETGKTIQVPLFIREGELVKVSTTDGTYMGALKPARLGVANRRKYQRDALRAEMAATRRPREPLRIPTRWLKAVIALFLLPLAGIWTQTFFRCFSTATVTHDLLVEEEFWFFALGAVLWLIAFFGLPRPVLLYVFGHELTHAVWVWLLGGRVNAFKIRSEGGHILTDTSNFWIALAPYFYPIYSIALLVVYFVASLFTDIAPYHRWFFALLGATWCFHITFTLWVIPKGQTDLTSHGTFFSIVIIYLMNLLVLSLLLIFGSSELGVKDFGREFVRNADALAGWADQHARHFLR